MANPHKGEVEFTLYNDNGQEKNYVLRFNATALKELEDRCGFGLAALADEEKVSDRMGYAFILNALAAGLKSRHPNMNIRRIGDLMHTSADWIQYYLVKIVEAINVAQEAGAENPPPPLPALRIAEQESLEGEEMTTGVNAS
jgi:hypothetical protein